MNRVIYAQYDLRELSEWAIHLNGYPTISDLINTITTNTESSGFEVYWNSTYYTSKKTFFDTLTTMAFNLLSDHIFMEFELSYGYTDAPSMREAIEAGNADTFCKKLGYFVDASTKYIERIEYYDTYKAQLMTGSTKNETHSGIDNSTRNAYDSRTSKMNNTPQEDGDYTGDGYVNEVTTINGSTSVGGYTTYGHKIDYTTNEDVAKRLKNADKAIKNIYSEWLNDFKNICLID